MQTTKRYSGGSIVTIVISFALAFFAIIISESVTTEDLLMVAILLALSAIYIKEG